MTELPEQVKKVKEYEQRKYEAMNGWESTLLAAIVTILSRILLRSIDRYYDSKERTNKRSKNKHNKGKGVGV